MPATAISKPPTDLTAAKRERISPRVLKAVQALIDGDAKTQRQAAELAGITPTWLCLQLKKPAIQAFIARKARETISNAQLPAVATIVRLLNAESEHVSLDASKHVLAIGGIRPPEQGQATVNVGVSVGYVINLTGQAHAGPLIDSQLVDGAKPLTDKGDVGT